MNYPPPTLLELVRLAISDAVEGVLLVGVVHGRKKDLGLAAFNEPGIWITDRTGMSEGHLRYPGLLAQSSGG